MFRLTVNATQASVKIVAKISKGVIHSKIADMMSEKFMAQKKGFFGRFRLMCRVGVRIMRWQRRDAFLSIHLMRHIAAVLTTLAPMRHIISSSCR